jgi:hypothetical protein
VAVEGTAYITGINNIIKIIRIIILYLIILFDTLITVSKKVNLA